MPTPTQPTDFQPKKKNKGKKQQKEFLKAIAAAQGGVTNKPVTTAADWKRGGSAGTHDVELPSGHVVQVKRVDLPALLADGTFPDSLLGIILEKLDQAEGKSKRTEVDTEAMDANALKGMMGDPKKIADLFSAFDRIAARVIVQPPVKLHTDENGVTIPFDERDSNFVYTDDIEMDDKSFLFQFSVGGTGELETFRSKRDALLADVENVESAPQASE